MWHVPVQEWECLNEANASSAQQLQESGACCHQQCVTDRYTATASVSSATLGNTKERRFCTIRSCLVLASFDSAQ